MSPPRVHRQPASPTGWCRRLLPSISNSWLGPASLWLAVGCGSHLSSGILAFDEARYPDAGAELRRVDQAELDVRTRTRWALYLGLSELALGNVARASCALQRARSGLNQTPDALSHIERGRLDAAWRSMGKAPGEPLVDASDCPS